MQRGLELQSKTGTSTRFNEMETDIGTCLSKHVAVFVSLKFSYLTQLDLNSIVAKLVKSFRLLVYLIPKESSLS